MAAHSQLVERLITLVRERGTHGTLSDLLNANDMPEGAAYAKRMGLWAALPAHTLAIYSLVEALALGLDLPPIASGGETTACTKVLRFGDLRADALLAALAILGCEVAYSKESSLLGPAVQKKKTEPVWHAFMSHHELRLHVLSHIGNYDAQAECCRSEGKRLPNLPEALHMLLTQVVAARLAGLSLRDMALAMGYKDKYRTLLRIRCLEQVSHPGFGMQSLYLSVSAWHQLANTQPEFEIGYCHITHTAPHLGTFVAD